MAPQSPTARAAGGFTLVELLVALALAALLLGVGLGSHRGHDLRAGRLDAVEALTRVQQAQEQHRSAHGLYASELAALGGTAALDPEGRFAVSPQGRYAIHLAITGGEAYRATAVARGKQAQDTDCAELTLEVRQGFAQAGPDAGCWHR